MRIAAAKCLVHILCHAPVKKMEGFVDRIEESIRNNILDSIPEVRDLSRTLFESYKSLFGSRVDR